MRKQPSHAVIPSSGQLRIGAVSIRRQQLHAPSLGGEQAGRECADFHVQGARQRFRVTVVPSGVAVLPQPVHAELAWRVKIALLPPVVRGDGAV